jgi:hypothetical protein
MTGFTETCGCTWSEGQWFPCAAHSERCYYCEVPQTPAAQGICVDCLEAFDTRKYQPAA